MARPVGSYTGKRITVSCKNCSKTFVILEWKIKFNRGKFCSRSCACQYNHTGKPSWNKGLVGEASGMMGNKLCVGRKASEETRRKLSASLRKLGSKSHLWVDGKGHERRDGRENVEYRIWRDKVFDRDNYSCVECGAHGVHLQADHIKPYALFPELRLNLENGRTLCRPCHRKTPTYGYGTRKLARELAHVS